MEPGAAAARTSRETQDVALLTGPDAVQILSHALSPLGQSIVDCQVHAVHHRPGAGVSVGYSLQIHTVNGTTSHYLCATTARLSMPDAPGIMTLQRHTLRQAGFSTVPAEGEPLRLWFHPADPELPALAAACTPSLLSQRVGERVRPEIVAYRPTRRAVIRVNRTQSAPIMFDAAASGRPETLPGSDGVLAYAKILRPPAARDFVERHQMLAEAGIPVPAMRRHDPDGFILLDPGVGRPLSGLISDLAHQWDEELSARVFHQLVQLLDALPDTLLALPPRPAWSDRVMHYAHAAATALPEQAARAWAVGQGVEELMRHTDPGPLVAVHGDFYEANVLMAGGQISALLDLDSVGPGRRVDDLACLLGHVSVLDHVAPESYPHMEVLLTHWTALAQGVDGIDPVALRARCAGVVLSLVAGARREEPQPWLSDALGRLARAESWLAGAREIQARQGPH